MDDAVSRPAPNSGPDHQPSTINYFPNYHRHPHNDAWYGEGWTEWELVQRAPPRFEGHLQPQTPSWGHFNEADPEWAAREIALAADHGITGFLMGQPNYWRIAGQPYFAFFSFAALDKRTEGSDLLPDAQHGEAYLKALRFSDGVQLVAGRPHTALIR